MSAINLLFLSQFVQIWKEVKKQIWVNEKQEKWVEEKVPVTRIEKKKEWAKDKKLVWETHEVKVPAWVSYPLKFKLESSLSKSPAFPDPLKTQLSSNLTVSLRFLG